MHWVVETEEKLLSFVKKRATSFSTPDLRWSIEHNRCRVNGMVERFSSVRLKRGDEVKLWPEKKPALQHDGERVLYEDGSILIYDKPPFFDSSKIAAFFNFHLAHRLDRDTSGLLVLVKKEEELEEWHGLFRRRKVEKEYLAIVEGLPKTNGGVIELQMETAKRTEGAVFWKVAAKGRGMWSKTDWECLKRGKRHALLRCMPFTGRTHQIRVHFKALEHPIFGDRIYGNKKGIDGLFRPLLHASKLSFGHPLTRKKIEVSAQVPSDFSFWLQRLI